MMKRRVMRSVLCVALAAALAVSLSALAYAAGVPDGFPAVIDPGKTMVGVQTADLDSSTLSYTVPLYVTLAVTNKTEKGTGTTAVTPAVVAPDNYRMTNTSLTPENAFAPIAVTGISVEDLPGKTWTLSTRDPSTTLPGMSPNRIHLILGGVSLPGLDGTTDTIRAANIKEKDPSDPSSTGNVFYRDGKYQPIAGLPMGTQIPIKGVLPPKYKIKADVPTVPQFRVHYTVSMLNKAGMPVGMFYDGPVPANLTAK